MVFRQVIDVGLTAREGRGGIRKDLYLDGVGSEAVVAQNLHGLVQRAATRAVVVKEISGNQDHVALKVFGQIQDLFEGGKRVESCMDIVVDIVVVVELL
jgi:hypothetical protein